MTAIDASLSDLIDLSGLDAITGGGAQQMHAGFNELAEVHSIQMGCCWAARLDFHWVN